MTTIDLPKSLQAALSYPLPGPAAQEIMAPVGRNQIPFIHQHSAAVLIALFQQDDQWRFPLIKRVEDEFVHSGQVGLPGGRIEATETPVKTALREANEEVGLNPDTVRIIGQLTPLPIPVSKFLVFPVVGVVNEQPQWNKNSREVESIFTVSLDDICEAQNVKIEPWHISIGLSRVPFFHLGEHKVWGATAMILSELKSVLTQAT